MAALMTLDECGFPILSGANAHIHATGGRCENESISKSGIPSAYDCVSTGTTIVGCIYNGGVALAADTRTSAGSYVVNRAARKISRIHDLICVCRSGSAADTQAVTQICKLQLQQFVQEQQQVDKGKAGGGVHARVRVAAHLFRRMCYQYKDQLSAGLIVGGYDPVEGPQIYSIPLGGAFMPLQYAAGGSGSVYVTAFMDENFRPGMSKEEAVAFLQKSVAHAISRDGSSGGMIRVCTIEKNEMAEFCIYGEQLPVPS